MKAALSQVCSLNWPFADDVADYAAGHCEYLELWFTKLESFLKQRTTDDVRRLLDEHRVAAPVASYQGGILSSQGEQRRAAWELFGQRLELCRQLAIGTMVIACDVPAPLDQAGLERVQHSLRDAATRAADREVRLALEFQASSILGNNLQTAAALVQQTDNPYLGLCLDAFHYFVGPSQAEDLGCVTSSNLFHVQLCDLADTPRELASDSDRILPGDGDIPLAPVLERLREIDYQGLVSVELLNPQIAQIPPLQFGEIAITALRKLLGQADRGG